MTVAKSMTGSRFPLSLKQVASARRRPGTGAWVGHAVGQQLHIDFPGLAPLPREERLEQMKHLETTLGAEKNAWFNTTFEAMVP